MKLLPVLFLSLTAPFLSSQASADGQCCPQKRTKVYCECTDSGGAIHLFLMETNLDNGESRQIRDISYWWENSNPKQALDSCLADVNTQHAGLCSH